MIFRVSEAESYRQWRNDEDADMGSLLARLSGAVPPSEAMRAGTAFHKALEDAKDGEADTLEAEGYRFIIIADITLALPSIREVRAYKDYGGITITGKLDVLDGRRVEDHKTTAQFNPDHYLEGFQWRYYLDLFGADCFRWNVFELKPLDEPRLYEVRGFHQLEQWRYPSMERDCRDLAIDLAAFAADHMPERRIQCAA